MIGARGALIAIAGLSLAACAKAPVPLAVPQVIHDIRALDGQTVLVAGYLDPCDNGHCELFVDQAGQKLRQRRIDMIVNRSREHFRKGLEAPSSSTLYLGNLPPDAPWLGIGGDPAFGRKAAPFENGFVVITGKVTSKCRTPDGQPACADLSTDIIPTDIVSLKES